jgi:hypothetical protein
VSRTRMSFPWFQAGAMFAFTALVVVLMTLVIIIYHGR